MNPLAKILKTAGKQFEAGEPLNRFFPLYEAVNTFLLTPGTTARRAPFLRDAADLKRVMILVVIGLLPCLGAGIYNVGYQVLAAQGLATGFWRCVTLGLGKVLPVLIVAYTVGGFWEVLFALVRRHDVSEGFLVTGMLFGLIMPPTIPLWQVAVGISFGVIIGKEIFGGTGYNVLNPALTGRAFLFFSYPAQFSGDEIWIALDGVSRATPLAVVAEAGRGGSAVAALAEAGYHYQNLFLGSIPGVIGETSKLACLLGLAFLLLTGVANWRVVAGCVLGLLTMSSVFYGLKGPEALTAFSLPPHWHLVVGSFAFGAIFMATDPVSACITQAGRWIYGFLIGSLIVIIRILNPAFTEGTMLSILLMNIFAPLIDHFVIQNHITGRRQRLESFAKMRRPVAS